MKIKDLRNRTGLSQSKFSQMFHLNVRTLQTWEQGTRPTPPYVLYMIERILDLEKNSEKEK